MNSFSYKPRYKVDSKNLDNLQNYGSWDMKPVDRSLDVKKVKSYLESIDNSTKREISEKIISNTKYIPFSEFKNKYLDLIKQLPKKYNLAFLTHAKIGSEHWLMVMLWPYLKTGCAKVINSHYDLVNLDNNYPILVVDDCMYSGCNMCYIIDSLQYNYENYTKKELTNSFIVMTAYRGVDSTNQLCKDFGTVKIITGEIITPPKLGDYKYMYGNFGCESCCVLPLYFDHKIANEFGSYPEIYTKIIKNQPSRYQIEKLESILEKNI